jgi:hypothetical protein
LLDADDDGDAGALTGEVEQQYHDARHAQRPVRAAARKRLQFDNTSSTRHKTNAAVPGGGGGNAATDEEDDDGDERLAVDSSKFERDCCCRTSKWNPSCV